MDGKTEYKIWVFNFKKLVERWNHLNELAGACVISWYYQIAYSRKWLQNTLVSVTWYPSKDASLLGRIESKPRPGWQSYLILAKRWMKQVDSSVTPFNLSGGWSWDSLIWGRSPNGQTPKPLPLHPQPIF